MLATIIEDEIIRLLTEVTITEADTHVVEGIDKVLLSWSDFESFPRIIVSCEESVPDYTAIQRVGKTYFANIFLLNYGPDITTLVEERDIIAERVEKKLRANQRLNNLVDNNSNEKVWDCVVGRTRFSKTGSIGEYQLLTWIEVIVQSERIGPFT